MKYGLSEEQLKQIQDIISSYDEIDEAILFGSRAMDTYKEASDVDIALKGKNVNASLAARLKYRLEEDTYLPFFFDFIAYPTITNQALKKHIDTKGVSIYLAGWKECKLGDVLEINPTESLSKDTLAKKVSMDMLQPFTKRPPCFSIEEYNGGMKFRNGDTIVARITPCLENGKTAFIDILDDNEIGFGSTEYIVLRERQGISDKHFLYYFAISPEFRDIAILSMTGSSGRQRVQTDVVRNHSFLLPPLPEQKAIASVLSSLDDKIDLLHRQNKTLEAMAETLFRQWFVEEAQKDWERKTLSSIAEHKKINVRPDQNPGTLYCHYSIPAFDDGKHPIKELGSEIKSNKYQVVADSILISKLNPRFPRVWGIAELLDDYSICSTEFQVVYPIKSEYYGFIYCFLKSRQVTDELIGAAGGTSGSHQRVKPEDIFNLTCQMPPPQKLDDFNLIFSENWKKLITT